MSREHHRSSIHHRRGSHWLRRLGLPLAIATALLALPAAGAALTIQADAQWHAMEPCPDDWAAPSLDDSSWGPAIFPWIFIFPRDIADMPEGKALWSTTSRPSCVRRHFHLPRVPTEPAVLKMFVDDDYELFINGTFVGASTDQMAVVPGETYDVSSFLRSGDNVIALKLISAAGEEQGALFSLRIPGIPEEPATFADFVAVVTPWLTLLGIVIGAGGVIVGLRILSTRGAPWLRNASAPLVAAATVVVLIVCQWRLQTGLLYSVKTHPLSPWAEWDWPQLAVVIALLALLALLGTREWESTERPLSRRMEWLALAGIVGVALFLRTVALDSVPTGFFQDEAINGIDALSLFDGRPFELWSDSIGGRPTLFLYLLGASLQVLGRSYLALKVVPVLFAVGSVVAVYAMGRLAIGPRAALWGAFFLAVSWWHIAFSRQAWEVNCVTFFSAVGFAFLLRGLGPSRRPGLDIVIAAVLLTVGLYTYAAYRAVVAVAAVFLGASLLSADRAIVRRRAGALIVAGIIALAVAGPLLHFAWQNPRLYWRRYDDVSLTKYMSYHGTPVPLVHQLGKSLLSLNQRGEEHKPGSVPYLDAVTGALLLLGLVCRVPAERQRGYRLLWVWFLTFFALSSLTRDAPHMTRSLGVAPAVVLFAGYGATRLLSMLRAVTRSRFVSWGVAGFLVLCALALNTYQYFIAFQNLPDADLRTNLKARVLCETFRKAAPATFYVTLDLDYWIAAQCRFLIPAELGRLEIVKAPDLANPQAIRNAKPPVFVAVGGEFLDIDLDKIPHDANGEPRLDLPVRPRLYLDREARRMFYLYAF